MRNMRGVTFRGTLARADELIDVTVRAVNLSAKPESNVKRRSISVSYFVVFALEPYLRHCIIMYIQFVRMYDSQ